MRPGRCTGGKERGNVDSSFANKKQSPQLGLLIKKRLATLVSPPTPGG